MVAPKPRRLFVRIGGHDRLVRMPNGIKLTTVNCPPEGMDVEWSLYIQRRLDCGDLIEVTADPAPAFSAAADKGDAE